MTEADSSILITDFHDDSTVDVTFFVPCLNEADNIVATLNTICEAVQEVSLPSYEILVVDDFSSDNTSEVVLEYAHAHPDVPIRLRQNKRLLGLGRNYADCAYLGSGRHYMMVAGDNAEPKEAIVEILRHMGEADIIIPYFGEQEKRSWLRKMISHAYTGVVNILSGNHIHYYNGSMLHKRINVMRWHSDTHGFAYQAQIATRLLDEGATYLEVNVPNMDRAQGVTSAFRIHNLVSVTYSLIQIFMRQIRFHLLVPPEGKKLKTRGPVDTLSPSQGA